MDRILKQLSSSLNTAETIDQLVRPMLDMLGTITGMESTYLTGIDLEQHTQRIRFARNSGTLQIAEGMVVPWADTLCKRALEMGQLACDAVPELWADSDAAAQLQIQTYVSAPINNGEGELLGTLCAASTSKLAIAPNVEALFQLFANIVGNFIEREVLVEKLQAANDQLAAHALTDLLTGLPNRRAMFAELEHMLALASRSRIHVLVGVIDLDGFKDINDRYGHQGGDDLLRAIAQRLQGGMRSADLIGRMGGDEFLFVGPGPTVGEADADAAALHMQQRLSALLVGNLSLPAKPSAMVVPVLVWRRCRRTMSGSKPPFTRQMR
jgi:diguanylate cyclase